MPSKKKARSSDGSGNTIDSPTLDFIADYKIPNNIQRIDRHSAWFRKTQQITINVSRKHTRK